ncbi:MAG: tetratricopeptide repeat protein, partial [Acidobacteriota bacterium]
SGALTHYFMIGDKGSRFQQLADYMQMMQEGIAEEEAVGRAFGNLAQLERQLEQYVGHLSFYYLRVPTPASADPKQLPVRTLSLAEVLAARGDFFIHSARLPQARLMLEQAVRLDPQSPAAHESLGLLYLRQGDREKAAQHFSEAVKLDSQSFLAHFYAAEAAHETGAEGLDATERHLRKAIEINPDFVPAYSNLVGVLTARGRNLEEALQLAVQATKLEPGVLRHKMGVARVLMALQRGEEAQRLAEQALGAARTDVDRAEAETLLATLKRYEQRLAEMKRHQEEAAARQRELEERRRTLAEEEKKAREMAARFRDTGQGRPAQPNATNPGEKRPDSGAIAVVEGRIRAVRCEAPAVMVLSLDVRGTRHEFRAENLYAVQYRAAGRANRGDFRPCEELEGMSVRIEYLPTPGTACTGEILTVRIIN